MTTPYERVGGEAGLRRILTDFYDRIFDDLMIGFLFKGKDKARLIEREVQLTARVLGADVPYEGRPMREAHASVPILKGHFHRRNQLLVEVLADHAVPEEVSAPWLAHARSLEAAILGRSRHQPRCD